MIRLKPILEQTFNVTIYCDMDGVLVDFDKGFKELTGISPKKASKTLQPEQFWEELDKAGSAFWRELDWMPDGKHLWNYVQKHNTKLLSAPSRHKSSRIGKKEWVAREIPGTFLILVPRSEKKDFASRTSILIDDFGKNIDEWIRAGGIGIHHKSAEATIKELENYIL